MRLHRRDGVERHADHDEERRPAEVERDAELADEDGGEHADDRHVDGACQGDADQDPIDEVRGALARSNAGNVAAELLEVVRHVARVEGDRGVEVAEEDDQPDVDEAVEERARRQGAR